MKYFSVHLADLESDSFARATAEQVAAWVFTHGLCSKLKNSGIIEAARDLGARYWARHGICEQTIKGESPLWKWQGADLHLDFYDARGQELFEKKVAGGKAGGRGRKDSTPIESPESTPIESPRGTADTYKNRVDDKILEEPLSPAGASSARPERQSPPRKKSKPKEEASPQGLEFADWFKSTLPDGTKLQDGWRDAFAKTFDDLVRMDGRSAEDIRRVSAWARTDDFWAGNFMSPAKLRKRNGDGVAYFDVFAAKASAGQAGNSKPKVSL